MVSRRQIKHAIKVLEQACDEDFAELKQEIKTSLELARSYITETDKKINALVHDQGKSQSVFGFTEEHIKYLSVTHSQAVKKFIENFITRQADWRFPWCWLIGNHYQYVHLSVKSTLVYLCSNHVSQKEIQFYTNKMTAKTSRAKALMYRLKPLQHTGIIEDHHVPHNQIGSLMAIDLLPYYSLEQIANLIQSCANLLRPGGQAMLHFADGDHEQEWKAFIEHKIAYCNEEIIQSYAENCDLTAEFFHVDSMYSFVVLTKPGKKTSIKSHLTKITPL